jgi:hypothetical protein
MHFCFFYFSFSFALFSPYNDSNSLQFDVKYYNFHISLFYFLVIFRTCYLECGSLLEGSYNKMIGTIYRKFGGKQQLQQSG